MPVSLDDFFRIGRKYHQVVGELHGDTFDDERLWRLLERHTPPEVEPAMALRQLKEYEFLHELDGAERYYRLTPHVERLVGKLLKRQHESSARVIRGFLEELQEVGDILREAVDEQSREKVRLAVRDLENLVIRIREMARGNLDTITTQVEDITEQRDELTSRQRFERINRLWTKIVQPLQQLIEVDAPVDQQLDKLEQVLNEVRRRFPHYPLIRRRSASARVQLVSMRRELLQRHREVIGEVEPLYRRLRSESQLARGAAAALKVVRHYGAGALELDEHVRLFGWRPYNLVDDASLRSYIATVADYEPPEDKELAGRPDRRELPMLCQEEIRRALVKAVPVNDVLEYVLQHWAGKPLGVLLKAYSRIYHGEFGPITVPEGRGRRDYRHGNRKITAHPIQLPEVAS